MILGILSDMDRACARLLVLYDPATNRTRYLDRAIARTRHSKWEQWEGPPPIVPVEDFSIGYVEVTNQGLLITELTMGVTKATYADGTLRYWQAEQYGDFAVLEDEMIDIVRAATIGDAEPIVSLEAENERLRGIQGQSNADLARVRQEYGSLRAEVERLRTLLRQARGTAIRIVREDCGVCGGSGYADGGYPAQQVTRDMAIDAGQPEREGEWIGGQAGTECEYCGRPIAALVKHFADIVGAMPEAEELEPPSE